MMYFNGQNLQRKYSKKNETMSIQEKEVQKKDMEAMKKVHEKNRAKREARMNKRDEKHISPDKELENFEMNPESDVEIQKVQKKALEKTNVIARQYGLPQPNNPEALEHDRFHCATCDRKLHDPNAVKGTDVQGLFDDSDIRLLCCWCFGKFSDDDIKSTMRIEGAEADAEIRLKVYNPIESTKEEVESLTESRRIYLKSKLKKWQQDTALIGNIKHDQLADSDYMENYVLYNSKGIYSCTL